MLKKIYRLATPRLTKSKSIQSLSFYARYSVNNLDISRFAFVISKKIDKRSTQRNNVKRKLSSCIEEIFGKIKGGNDFVFYPKPGVTQISRKELFVEIENVLNKEGLLNK